MLGVDFHSLLLHLPYINFYCPPFSSCGSSQPFFLALAYLFIIATSSIHWIFDLMFQYLIRVVYEDRDKKLSRMFLTSGFGDADKKTMFDMVSCPAKVLQ